MDGRIFIDVTGTQLTSGYIGFRSHYSSGSFDRLKLTGNAGTTYYARGASGEVLAEYDAAGTLKVEYDYGGGERVALLRPGQKV